MRYGYETADRFGRHDVDLKTARFLASPEAQRREKFLRNMRIKRLDELIKQHRGDKDYFASLAAWRKEKLDLLAQWI